MNQNYYSSNTKGQNIRFVVVTALVALVIIGIAVWAVTFVLGNFNKKSTADNGSTNTTVSQVENNGNSTPAPSDTSAMPSPTATDPSAPANQDGQKSTEENTSSSSSSSEKSTSSSETTTNSQNTQNTQNSTSSDQSKTSQTESTTDKNQVNSQSSSAPTTEKSTSTDSKSSSSKSNSIQDATLLKPSPASTAPNTGPEDILPLALLAGVTAAYIASRRF